VKWYADMGTVFTGHLDCHKLYRRLKTYPTDPTIRTSKIPTPTKYSLFHPIPHFTTAVRSEKVNKSVRVEIELKTYNTDNISKIQSTIRFPKEI